MSLQRKRGQWVTVYASKMAETNRGARVVVLDTENPFRVRAAFVPLRSAKAEVPGQQMVDIYHMLVRADLKNVTLWSEVDWQNTRWDIVTPPALHIGERNTRHWSIDIRRKPAAVVTP